MLTLEPILRDYLVLITFSPIAIWFILSVIWLIGKRNPHYVASIPSGFTTSGVLGTFIGIATGLYFFNEKDISGSIPELLTGLKMAFLTSIVGIVFSMLFSKYIEFINFKNDSQIHSPETAELKTIAGILIDSIRQNESNIKALVDEIKAAGLAQTKDQLAVLKNILSSSSQIQDILEGQKEIQSATAQTQEVQLNALLSGQQGLKKEVVDQGEKAWKLASSQHKEIIATQARRGQQLIKTLIENNKELSKQLVEMNSKELLQAMEQSVEIFNNKMEDILGRLIKKNFESLNKSVQQLNNWQVQHKTNMELLIEGLQETIQQNKTVATQLKSTTDSVAGNLTDASEKMQEVAISTNSLSNDNGRLQKIVTELESIALGENQFKSIITQAETAIANMATSTTKFSDGMEQVEGIKNNLYGLQESMVVLTNELKELQKLKDVNEGYWTDVKDRLGEGVNVLNGASKRLSADLENIDEQFKTNLHETFINLDRLIQGYVVTATN